MTHWTPDKVRVVEFYDITWDIEIRRFSFVDTDGLTYFVVQPLTVPLEKLINSCTPWGKENAPKIFSPHDATLDEMMDKLRSMWEVNNARTGH